MKKQFRLWIKDEAGNLTSKVYEASELTETVLELARKDLGGSVYKIAVVGSDRDTRPEPPKPQKTDLGLTDPFGE